MNRQCAKGKTDEKCPDSEQISILKNQQAQRKINWIQSLLSHQVDDFVHSPKWKHYRSRISVRPNKNGVLGYYRQKSHDHLPLKNCPLAHREINALLSKLPPLSFPADAIEFRSDYQKIVASVTSKRRLERPQIIEWAKGNQIDLVLNGKPIHGDGRIHITCGNIRHRIRPKTFYQVNLEVNEMLLSNLIDTIDRLQPTHILDLFAGAGNLSLPLVKKGYGATLIESASSSCADARETIKRESLQATILQKNAYNFTAGQTFFDVAILDPPRKGCVNVIPQILMTSPKAIVYISCNPKALAKDIKPIITAGYKIEQLILFDMFPQTDHVEVFCVLTKNT